MMAPLIGSTVATPSGFQEWVTQGQTVAAGQEKVRGVQMSHRWPRSLYLGAVQKPP